MEQINKYIEHIKSLDGTELEEIIEFNVFEFLGSKSENNINTLIFSPSGANSGIGFAIPSDTAFNIANQIIQHGRARIPFMGIEMGPNETEIIGVYIQSVMEGYPAEGAGVIEGDVVTEIDGKAIETPYQLLAQMLRHNVGDVIELSIYRDSEYLTLSLELVETPVIKKSD